MPFPGHLKFSLMIWCAILLIASIATVHCGSSSSASDEADESLKMLAESFLPYSFLERPVTDGGSDSVKSDSKSGPDDDANPDELLRSAQDMMSGLRNIVNGLNAPDIGNCEFKCPKGAIPKPRPNHKPVSNGCGTHGFKADLTDYPGITGCCNSHDVCYETCNRGQAVCDRAFNACMADSCERMRSDGTIPTQKKFTQCMAIGAAFHLTAMTLGCEFYRQSQRSACLCGDGDEATVAAGESSQQEKIRLYNSEKRAKDSKADDSDYLDDIDLSSPTFDLPDPKDRQEL